MLKQVVIFLLFLFAGIFIYAMFIKKNKSKKGKLVIDNIEKLHRYNPNRAREMYNVLLNQINNGSNAKHHNENYVSNMILEMIDRNIARLERQEDNMLVMNNPRTILPEPIFVEQINFFNLRDDAIQNDEQNVHDSYLNNYASASINKLKENIKKLIPQEEVINEIRKTLNARGNHKAIRVFNEIVKQNTHIDMHGMTEVQMAQLIWSRINDVKESGDIEKYNNLLHSFTTQLEEAIEDNEVVCSMGRFNRLINSLNGIDNIVDLKPKWAVKSEMLNKAAIYRDEFDYPEDKDDYEKKLNEYLISKFKKEYKDVLPENEILDEIKSWNL